jgi:hypothetical protein
LVKAYHQQQGKESGHNNSKKEERMSKMELISNVFILLVGGCV